MIGVGNDRSTNTKNHTRMNLTVRVIVLLLRFEVAEMHRNHRCFFLINVEELNQACFQTIGKVHTLLLLHSLDVAFSQQKLILFNNKEWSLHSACISEEPNLFVLKVTHDRNLFRYVEPSPQTNDVLKQTVWIFTRAYPVAIDEDFDISATDNVRLGVFG